MGRIGFGFEFRMELAGHKPWVTFELNDLRQILRSINSRKEHAVFLKLGPIFVVEFIAVAVPFRNAVLAVSRIR